MVKYLKKNLFVFTSNCDNGNLLKNGKVNDVLVMAFIFNEDKTKIKILPGEEILEISEKPLNDYVSAKKLAEEKLIERFNRQNCDNGVRAYSSYAAYMYCLNLNYPITMLLDNKNSYILKTDLKIILAVAKNCMVKDNKKYLAYQKNKLKIEKSDKAERNF